MGCIFCQSTRHSYRECPVTWQQAKRKELNKQFKQEYFGEAPNVFVGRYGYPNIRVGILGTEQCDMHDDPVAWSKSETPIPKIVGLRSELVNSYFTQNIKSVQKYTEITKEVSLAKRPVDVEINLKKKPQFRITYSKHLAPHGPNVPVKKVVITENVKIDTRVEKATDAMDLKAADAIQKLMKNKIDPYYLTKAFSMGNFGIQTERKLVPTRWSITAVDDIQGKAVLNEVKDYKQSDCMAFFGGHYGNYYLILFFDDMWQYELFENHISSQQNWTDYEPFKGRTTYAKDTAGGYYAARIGILNKLKQMKRQSSVLVIRIITDEYTAPLGVWVCREAVKKTLETKPIKFADKKLMLEYAKEFLNKKFSYKGGCFPKSLLLKNILGQKKLTNY